MIVIQGEALAHLLAICRDSGPGLYKVSIDERKDGVAIKANEFMWSSTLPSK